MADAVVIGAGPAGLTAAIAAARSGLSVTVLERMARPGLKLLASGGGRCNLTNTLPAEAFMAAFGRHGRFMQDALRALDAEGLRRFLGELGVPTVREGATGIYPASGSARTVLEALLRECRRLGVRICAGEQAAELRVADGAVAGVVTPDGPITARSVVLAAGGRGYPALGGTDAGYRLAAMAGHAIVPPTPANVPLLTEEAWPGTLAGVSLPDVEVRIALKGYPRAGVRGAMLFTHRGLSGPAILDVSGDVAEALRGGGSVPLTLRFAAGAADSPDALAARWHAAAGRRAVATQLREVVPDSLGRALCGLAGLDPAARADQAGREPTHRLLGLLWACPLAVRATEGFTRAMVTRGGVALSEVAPATLASRLVRGLFLAGEVLDLDGPCGGFNLQWAFASGHLAGTAAARQAG